ncbi:monocarboxylate transporter 14 [Aplysia californica]|uniref:Monocarboxylate transporter 14 n=1 Tax=Aplysia californica TaxID=6500 RepID=A0ABM1W1Q9_APLCA|nr:monocarboxylate transporter 14 [Aplysia californica]
MTVESSRNGGVDSTRLPQDDSSKKVSHQNGEISRPEGDKTLNERRFSQDTNGLDKTEDVLLKLDDGRIQNSPGGQSLDKPVPRAVSDTNLASDAATTTQCGDQNRHQGNLADDNTHDEKDSAKTLWRKSSRDGYSSPSKPARDSDDDDEDGDVENGNDRISEDPVPYDKGWAWMITLGAFIVLLLVPGYHVVMSVMLLDIVDHYQTSVTMVTVMQSLASLTFCFSCQLSMNLLLPQTSFRVTTVTGAVVNAGCTLLMTFAPSMEVFTLLNVLKALGQGGMVAPALTLVGLYFRRRRALASSISLLGVSFASILVPQLTGYIKEQYGFSGCYLLLSAYELHLRLKNQQSTISDVLQRNAKTERRITK